ncbi:Clp protease N-terminal domain-containing protein [Pseudonocardia adelaidensis]|uniref:Clp protease N-terminal domain-containing protein n=1 Tax=Pseudonocardia adelaidensis TaxID=648754 RepID=UPI0031E56747
MPDDAAPPRPTPRYRNVLRHAEDQASRHGHHRLGVEHLLLGILDDGESVATGVLAKYVDLPELRKAVERVLASEGYNRPAQAEPDGGGRSASTPVTLVRGDERQQAVIHWAWQGRSGPSDLYRAQLDWSGEPIDVGAGDMFDALVRIREQLEPQGWFVAVQGSRLDAFPSAMQREMAGGLNVYVMRVGEPIRLGDAVETFAEADPGLLATVAAQHQHAAKWQRSVQGGVGSPR